MQKHDREMWFAYDAIKKKALETTGKEQKKYQEQSIHFRNCLLESNNRLVGMVVSRHKHHFQQVPDEDLMQVGRLGLLSAVELFNPHNGTAFSTYAVRFIFGRMRQYMRDRVRLIRLNQSIQEQVWAFKKAREKAEIKTGKTNPPFASIKEFLSPRMQEISKEEWNEILSYSDSTECYSYDNTLAENEELEHASRLGVEDPYQPKARKYKNSIFKKDVRIKRTIRSLKQLSIF